MEAKSNSWVNFSSERFALFRDQIGNARAIATQHGYEYLVRLLNKPPDYVIQWLEKKGIQYIIETEQ